MLGWGLWFRCGVTPAVPPTPLRLGPTSTAAAPLVTLPRAHPTVLNRAQGKPPQAARAPYAAQSRWRDAGFSWRPRPWHAASAPSLLGTSSGRGSVTKPAPRHKVQADKSFHPDLQPDPLPQRCGSSGDLATGQQKHECSREAEMQAVYQGTAAWEAAGPVGDMSGPPSPTPAAPASQPL